MSRANVVSILHSIAQEEDRAYTEIPTLLLSPKTQTTSPASAASPCVGPVWSLVPGHRWAVCLAPRCPPPASVLPATRGRVHALHSLRSARSLLRSLARLSRGPPVFILLRSKLEE